MLGEATVHSRQHTLAIQKFLRKYNPRSAPRHAEEKLCLRVKQKGNLFQFNYTAKSPGGVQEVEECRGLILEHPSWKVISYPFYRFYNAYEEYADKPSLEDSILWEKLDGSLIVLYFYQGEWRVSTRQTISADGSVGSQSKTFHELFWEIVRKNYTICNLLYLSEHEWLTDLCIFFELIGPENRVVTPYRENKLRLIGLVIR